MVVGDIPLVQQIHSQRQADRPTDSAGGLGNALPPANAGESVDISGAGRSALEREMQNIAEARDAQQFIDLRGYDGKIRLGLMALGQSAMDNWLSKGLEMSEQSILAAGEAFQNAFHKNLEQNGFATAGSSIALNRYQIVVNSQPVPGWFVKEYEISLSSTKDSELKRAFENGDLYYISKSSASRSEALYRYSEVKNSF